MRFRDSHDLLIFWESKWGPLPAHWRTNFLLHPAIQKMLYFPDDWISESISRKIKLDDALKLLEKSAAIHFPEYSSAPPLEEIETPAKYAERMKRLLEFPDVKIPEDDWWREQN